MKDVLRYGKKLFTVSVASLTIAWSMGLAALLPAGVSAETCPTLSAGSLVKTASASSVYMLSGDMKRLDFPNGEVFKTWFADYSGVVTIPGSCLEAYPYGGMVSYRPGARLIKVQSLPSVYAVLPGNMKAKIGSEDVAKDLYGANWAKLVRDFPDNWMQYYGDAPAITESVPQNGQLVKKSGGTDVYFVSGGSLSKVDGSLSKAASGDVRTVSEAVFNKLSTVSAVVTPATVVADPAQGRSGGPVLGSTAPAVVGGNLSVSLAASNPAASNVADGTAYDSMLKLNLSASNGAVAVKGLTVTRTGLMANTNVTGVSVWDSKGYRHGDVMTSFNSSNQVVIGFAANPILVASGSSEEVTVAFNLGASASGGTVGASVNAATDVSTNGTVTGSFPVNGNIMNVVDGASSLSDVNVEYQSVGGMTSGNAASTAVAGNVEIGETKDIAKIKFTQSNGLNDVVVNGITFYLSGTAKEKDLKDFTLVAPDNTVLGTTQYASDRYVTIKLTSPYTVPKSTNRTLTLRATVADGSGNYFQVQVQNDYDVLVSDKALGYSLVPNDGDGDATDAFAAQTDPSGYFKMKSGALTVSRSATSPSGNVSSGSSDVVLAKFDVKAVGEDLEIRKIGVVIATTSSAGNDKYDLSGNVMLRVGSDVLLTFSGDYTSALYSTGSQRNLSQYLTIKSGETKTLEVVGNIDSAATSTTYAVSVGNFYAKRLSTLDFADNLPSTAYTSASGNTLTVQSTSLTVAKDTTLGNRTLSKAATQVIGQYVLQGGTAEEVCVTNLSIDVAGNGTIGVESFQNMELWLGNTQYGSTVSSVATSSNSFNGNRCLAKNERQVLQVKAYVTSNAGTGPASTTLTSHTYVGKSTNNTNTVTTDFAGQNMTFGAANVIITAASDATTVSSIRLPGATEQQLGKWKFETQNENVTVKKLTFAVRDDSYLDDTSAGNFGTLSLYDSANMTTPIGTASYVPGSGNGYVQFTGMNWSVPSDSTKYLVLKGIVNGSGTMDTASINEFLVRSDSTTDMEMTSASGSALSTSQIDAVSGDNTTNSRFATSTYYLFHNAAPTLASQSIGSTLELSSQAQLFKFTVTNPGDRVLSIASTTINVSASGLTAASASTGTISSWALYEANSSGGLGTQIAATSGCKLRGGADASGTGNTCDVRADQGSTINVAFSTDNDTNSAMDNLTVDPGSSRTFVLVADTTSIFNGKTTGSVSVSAKLDGATGFDATADTTETNWADGVVMYYYTPVGGSQNTTVYSASDSYDVVGGTVSRSL